MFRCFLSCFFVFTYIGDCFLTLGQLCSIAMKLEKRFLAQAKQVKVAGQGVTVSLKKRKRNLLRGGPSQFDVLAPDAAQIPKTIPTPSIPVMDLEGEATESPPRHAARDNVAAPPEAAPSLHCIYFSPSANGHCSASFIYPG